MENKQGTSFIPKSPTRASTKPVGVRKVFILTYVTSVLFFGTIIAAIVVFIWNSTTDTQLSRTKQLLEDRRTDFNQASLEQVRELEARLVTATGLLNRQVSVSVIFTALENAVYLPVRVTGFDYTKNNAGSFDLALAIRARNFNDALVQRNGLLAESVFEGALVSGPIFTNPEPPEDATYLSSKEVQYVIEKEITPDDIPYVAQEQVLPVVPLDESQDTYSLGSVDGFIETPSSDSSVETGNTDGGTAVGIEAFSEGQPVDITDNISN